jgi:hypothetical protein
MGQRPVFSNDSDRSFRAQSHGGRIAAVPVRYTPGYPSRGFRAQERESLGVNSSREAVD